MPVQTFQLAQHLKLWQSGKRCKPVSMKTCLASLAISNAEAVKSTLTQVHAQRTASRRVTVGVPFISST